MNGDPQNPLTTETKSCSRCDGRGRIEPFWPVGPSGARLDDHKCSTCGGTGIVTISRPVMNSLADEAEARDRANAAPSPADPDAGCRGVSGLTSGSEARPVTPTAQYDWSAEPRSRVDLTTPRMLRLIEMDAVPAYVVRALLRERDEWRQHYWDRMTEFRS